MKHNSQYINKLIIVIHNTDKIKIMEGKVKSQYLKVYCGFNSRLLVQIITKHLNIYIILFIL